MATPELGRYVLLDRRRSNPFGFKSNQVPGSACRSEVPIQPSTTFRSTRYARTDDKHYRRDDRPCHTTDEYDRHYSTHSGHHCIPLSVVVLSEARPVRIDTYGWESQLPNA